MQKQIKAYSGLNTEWVDGGFKMPSELLMEAEEAFGSIEVTEAPTRTMSAEEALKKAEAIFNKEVASPVQTKKGQIMVIPKFAGKYFKEAVEGLENPDDIIASSCYAITRCREIGKWIEAQQAIRKGTAPTEKLHTVKVDGKWNDAQCMELPPLINEASNARHWPSVYMIRTPDGRLITTGKKEGNFNVKLYQYPSQGLQGLAQRIGLKIRGGDKDVLRAIIGRDDIVPAYLTIWAYDRWNTIVGYRRSDDSPTKYWLNAKGEITDEPQDAQEPLNHKEFLYEHIRESCTFEVVQKDGTSDYVIEPEDEAMMLGNERAADSVAIDLNKLDDDERELVSYIQNRTETSENFLTEGDLISHASQQLLIGECVGLDIKTHEEIWEGGLMGHTQMLNRLLKIKNPSEEQLEIIEFLEVNVPKLERMNRTFDRLSQSYGVDHGSFAIKEPKYIPRAVEVTKIQNAHILPDNQIEVRPTCYADALPDHKSTRMVVLKRGRTTLRSRNGQLHREIVPLSPTQPTSARNASPSLMAVLRRMIRNDEDLALRA